MSEDPSDERLDAAVAAISDPERLRDAEALVLRAAPALQRILAEALAQGGWFGPGHDQAVSDALAEPDPDQQTLAIRTLLAEETRLGMFVGVTIGVGLAQQLGLTTHEPLDEEN